MTCTALPATAISAVFQVRLHAFMPPSREYTWSPRAASCSAAIWLVLPAPHTVTIGRSVGRRTSRRVTGCPSSSQARRVSTEIVIIPVAPFRLRQEAQARANPPHRVRAFEHDTHAHVTAPPPHQQRRNTGLGNRQ